MKQITIAVTHYNRFPMLCESLEKIADDPRISEIVISDDCSTDGSWEKAEALFGRMNDIEKAIRKIANKHIRPKIKLTRNERNLDCYLNKREAVRQSTSEWVILLDSDNVITPAYLDALFAAPEWVENGTWDKDTVYTPEFAEPHFDFRAFSGLEFDKASVAAWMKEKLFPTMLNACNYFVHRQTWLDAFDDTVNPHTADSIFQAYNLLKGGAKFYVVPGLRYFHRVHAQSHYKLNNKRTGNFMAEVENKLRALR